MSDVDNDVTDPVNSTAISISRRGFAVLGSAALIGAGALQDDDFGKPHAPIVAEDDPAIHIVKPRLSSAGATIDAYAATPRSVSATSPGVVVVQHIWGVDAQIRDVVRRLAKSGYIAIAPLLYSRLGAPSGDGQSDISLFRKSITDLFAQGHQNDDIAAARHWIGSQTPKGKAGITGFCVGGALVLQALQTSTEFAAASVFYGDVTGVAPDKITARVLGNYGARDTSIKPDDVRGFFAHLRPAHDVKIYDEAGHAFFDDTRARYVPGPATDAWHRTLSWFQQYLTA